MYTLKFVGSEEFNKLRYKGVSEALGIADRNKGIAYVRDNANPLDVFTAFHELEHLKGDDLGEYSDPDENGVYYKKLNEVLGPVSNVASVIPGPWQAPAIAYSTYSGVKGMMNKGQQQPQPQQQQGTMDQFNPSAMAAPATSQVSGPGGATASGGMGGGIIDRVRQFMSQRMNGFYAGRDTQ